MAAATAVSRSAISLVATAVFFALMVALSASSISSSFRAGILANFEAELAARTTSDLVIDSERGIADTELSVFVNSSDLNDLEDLAFDFDAKLTAATAFDLAIFLVATEASFASMAACFASSSSA